MPSFLRTPIALVTLVAATLVAAPAAAQQSEATRTALARRLFRQGVELARQEQYERAVERFERAFRLRPAAAVGYNLAQALVPLGRLVQASEVLRRALRDPDVGNVRPMAEELLAQLEPRLGDLTIMLEGPVEGVEITIDGQMIIAEAIGIAAPVDPGERLVGAVRGGEIVASRAVVVEEGGAMEVTLTVPPPTAVETAEAATTGETIAGPAPLQTPTDDDEDGGSVLGAWWLWTTIGILVAGGVVAAVLLATSGVEDPVQGNAMPGVITWD